MNISDEWETPEKQPFKDFVSIYIITNTSSTLKSFILLAFFWQIKVSFFLKYVILYFSSEYQ